MEDEHGAEGRSVRREKRDIGLAEESVLFLPTFPISTSRVNNARENGKAEFDAISLILCTDWPAGCGSSPARWVGCGRCLSRGRRRASLPPHRSSSMSASLAAAPPGSTPPTG